MDAAFDSENAGDLHVGESAIAIAWSVHLSSAAGLSNRFQP